jgi:uncharacterized caspase-like protein
MFLLIRCFSLVLSLGFLGIFSSDCLATGKVALVIGNGDYADKNARLNNPANDAIAISNSLTALGFEVILKTDASLDVMKQAVKDFSSKISSAEIAVFFYAGHALQFQNNNYLLPVNASLGSERDALLDGFDVGNIIYLMSSSQAKKIIILDACRDNPFKVKFRASSVGLAQVAAPPDSLIAYSTAPGALAYDGTGNNSLYTKHLMTFLKDTNLSIIDMFSKVGEAVQKETQSFKKPQIPFLLSSLTGQIGFSKRNLAAGNSATSNSGVAVLQQTGPSEDSKMNSERVFWESLDKTQSAELQLYLTRFPNGLFSEIAGARLTRMQTSAPDDSKTIAAINSTVQTGSKTTHEVVPTLAANQARGMTAAPNVVDQTQVKQQDRASTAVIEQGPRPQGDNNVPVVQRKSGGATVIRFSDGSVYDGATTIADAKNNSVPNGVGTFKGLDGYSYTGMYVSGKRQGLGKQVLANGDRFEGDFDQDLPHGKGVLIMASGDSYEGQIVRGQIEGAGIYNFKSGNSFRGSFTNSQPNGKGVFTYSNGDVYTGDIVAGVINGSGNLKTSNGIVYLGEFKNGAPSGKGVWTFTDGTVVEVSQNRQTGKTEGNIKFPSGDVYSGEIEGGRADGKGLMKFKNGQNYRGTFSQGRAVGAGVLSFANGDRFEGVFSGGLESAKGELISPSGERRNAEIVNGQTRNTQ